MKSIFGNVWDDEYWKHFYEFLAKALAAQFSKNEVLPC